MVWLGPKRALLQLLHTLFPQGIFCLVFFLLGLLDEYFLRLVVIFIPHHFVKLSVWVLVSEKNLFPLTWWIWLFGIVLLSGILCETYLCSDLTVTCLYWWRGSVFGFLSDMFFYIVIYVVYNPFFAVRYRFSNSSVKFIPNYWWKIPGMRYYFMSSMVSLINTLVPSVVIKI